jgi:hypothetical protein
MLACKQLVLGNSRILTDYGQKPPWTPGLEACGMRLEPSCLACIITRSFSFIYHGPTQGSI